MTGTREKLDIALCGIDRETVDHVTLRRRAAAAVRRTIGFDVAVAATVDPTTAMWTHCLLDGMERDQVLEEEVFRNEYHEADVLKLTDLLHRPGHVGVLHEAASAAPQGSARHREIYGPRGIADELRLLLVDGDTPWGALCLLRSSGRFTDEEAHALASVGPSLAAQLRRSLLHSAAEGRSTLDAPPGLIFCGPDGRVLEMSEEARELLAASGIDDVPQVVASVLAKGSAGARGGAALPTRDGRWLAFHPTTIGGRAVVIVEQVRALRLAELIVRARGLTGREREVVECVAQGASTRDIARRLFISEWTVQDHLKAVFAKFGVRSRQELVAAVFFDHYEPRHAAHDTPSPYGWYLDRTS